MRAFLTAVALILCFGPPLFAEPLDRRQVAADAKWLLHVDFDAVRSADAAGKILDHWLGRESVQRSLRKVRETFGADLAKDLHSVTFYSNRFSHRHGTVIVRVKADQPRLRGYFKKLPDFRTSSHRGHKLFAWTQNKGGRRERSVAGCFYRAEMMVFGQDSAEVNAALDVLDGKSKSLAGSGSRLATSVPPGTILRAGATGLAEAELPFKSPIIRRCNLLDVTVGEHGGEVFGRARLVAKSAEVAGELQTVIKGLHALAKLKHGNNEEAMEVLRALRVTKEEQTVVVQWQGSAEKVLRLIQNAWMTQHKSKQKD